MGCLKNLIITAVGDPGPGRGNEQLKRWVEANSGRWQPRVTKGITHVICSKDAWKKNVEAVQQAKKLGVFIVTYDWLEDSLMKKRKLAETKYTWEVLRTQRRTQKEMKRLAPKSDTLKFKKGCDLSREELGSGTSAPRKSGFFASSLEDMKKRREAREAATTTTAATSSADLVKGLSGDAVEDLAAPSAQPATVATIPTTPAPAIHRKPKPQPWPALPSPPQPESPPLSPDVSHPTSRPTPTATPKPSLFPPCLKYTPSTSSRLPAAQPPQPADVPPTPPSSKRPATPAPSAVQDPPVTKLTDLYHTYVDGTGFEYNIMLLRQNPYLNNHAKYTLRLYESHTKPHVYATAVRYTHPAGSKNAGGNGVGMRKLAEDDFSAILGMGAKNEKTKVSTATSNGQESNSASNPTTADTPSPSTSSAVTTEAARLTALITSSTPSPSTPYNKIITPPNTPFPTAFQAFRHIFRDLTLLTWEERLTVVTTPLSSPNSLQRLRAQAFQIEPFIWRAPAAGMPIGLMPKGLDGVDARVLDGSYVRNRYELPGLDEPLGDQGSVGSALVREAQEAVRKAEEEQRRRRAEEKRNAEASRPVKANYKQPLFNGVHGRPTKEECRLDFQHSTPRSTGTATPSSAPRGRSVGARAGGCSLIHPNTNGIGRLNGNGKREGRAVFTQFPRSKKDWRNSSFFGEQ